MNKESCQMQQSLVFYDLKVRTLAKIHVTFKSRRNWLLYLKHFCHDVIFYSLLTMALQLLIKK